jgi:hypothetical protein
VLTGPAGRRQSRPCSSVHGSRAEPSIRCSPVHGARAPTEHPNPASSAFTCRLWTPSPSCRASRTVEPQNTRPIAPVGAGACHLSSVNPGLRAPTDHHRLSTIPPVDRLHTAEGCAATACRARVRYRGPRRLAEQPPHSVRRGVLSPSTTCQHTRLSISDSIQARRSRPADAAPGTTCDPTAGKDSIARCRSSSYGPEVGTSVRSAPSDCFACRFLSRSPHRGHDCRGLKPRLRHHSFHCWGRFVYPGGPLVSRIPTPAGPHPAASAAGVVVPAARGEPP